MGKLAVKIKILTPIWTGGADGTMDRIHETGILGSLRWWYEAIVRGLGGYACDPTKHKHELSHQRLKRYKEARQKGKDWWAALDEAGICDACKVFGTTGWRRRFQLEVVDDQTTPAWQPEDKMLNIRPPGRTRGWYLPPGRVGSFTLRFTGNPKVLSLMAALLLFLEKWGSLGSKSQLGYGIFTIENREAVLEWACGNGDDKPGWRWKVLGSKKVDQDLPDLRRFGFFKYRFQTAQPGWWTQIPGLNRVATQVQPIISQFKIVPVGLALKNEWRFNQWNRKWGDDREIFGTLRPDRIRSKVVVSWAYKTDGTWEVRGWVWLSSRKWEKHLWNLITKGSIWSETLKIEGNLYCKRLSNVNEFKSVLNGLEP